MKKILFVDDEPNVLQGLQRMLRPMRHEWEMQFVTSGFEALDVLKEQSFHVIVSDMRMPGMTGAQLFTQVSSLYPHIVRIILSGQSDQEKILHSVGLTHQYLSKPCDAETLKCVVMRACELRNLLSEALLQNLMSQLKMLPSLPKLYTTIVERLNFPDATAREIGAIIAQDLSMTAKILQLLNSAFFGCPRRVSDPVQAVTFLGIDMIKTLVLSHSVFSQLTPPAASQFAFNALWQHSLRVAALARQVASEQERTVIEDAFTGGLLHDVGQLALAMNLPDQYNATLQRVCKNEMTLIEAEKESFGASHAEVGAYLMGLWGLPDSVVEAIAFHHNPLSLHGSQFSPLSAVYIANILDHETSPTSAGSTALTLDMDYLNDLGLADHLASWRALCQSCSEETVP